MFKKKKKKEPVFLELYFASKQEIKVKDLKEYLPDNENLNYWQVLDIMEYSFSEEESLTITPLDSDFTKEDEVRLTSLGIKTILEVSFNDTVEKEAMAILKDLTKAFDALLLKDDAELSIID